MMPAALPDLANDELLVLRVSLADGSVMAPAAPAQALHGQIAAKTQLPLANVTAIIAKLKSTGWFK